MAPEKKDNKIVVEKIDPVLKAKADMLKKVERPISELLESARNETDFQKKYKEKLKMKETDNGAWGGGTDVIRVSKSPLFYDLYMTDSDYNDSFSIKPNLPETAFFKAVGFERVRVQDLPEYTVLLNYLEKWRPKAAGLVDLILDSLNYMPLTYTGIPLVRIDGLVQTKELAPGEKLEPLIVFNEVIGARINRDLWYQSGDRSRLAALVHEALRNLQITLQAHYEEPNFDLKVQTMTNYLMMTDPSTIPVYMEYEKFFQKKILKDILDYEKSHLTMMEYVLVFKPELVKDHVAMARLRSNSEGQAKFIEDQDKSRFERSQFKMRNDLFSKLRSLEGEKLAEHEAGVRKYLAANKLGFNFSEKSLNEVRIKGLRHYNRFMQERWLDESLFEVYLSLDKLMELQYNNPQEDVFGKMDKYNCYTWTDWQIPVDKIQDRQHEKFIEQRAGHMDEYKKCIVQRSLSGDPRSEELLLILGYEPKMIAEVKKKMGLRK